MPEKLFFINEISYKYLRKTQKCYKHKRLIDSKTLGIYLLQFKRLVNNKVFLFNKFKRTLLL